MTQRVTGQRFRQRKLSTKQNLPVISENELDVAPDDDATRHIPKVETGVEKGEEVVRLCPRAKPILPPRAPLLCRGWVRGAANAAHVTPNSPPLSAPLPFPLRRELSDHAQEHHLQAVISAAQAAAQGGGKVAQLYIPTPDAKASKLQYADLYPRRFTQPATYIRFSSTVEDTIGCPYCMSSDDVVFLKAYNQKRGKGVQCSEDEFEEAMYFFEQTSHTKQPYASVDNAPVLSYEELEAEFDETISESARRFARDIYGHWKNQRLLKGNRPLMPSLKFETNLETDDSDPYVCFRRREVRQVRKTRGRDAQVTEKLKKLRKELEEARFLMTQVRRRELLKRDQLAMDKQIFEQRLAVKEIKRKLSIKGDDEELLINQKVRHRRDRLVHSLTPSQPAPKPKPRQDTHAVRVGIPGMSQKPPNRPDGRFVDSDLVYLEDQIAKRSEAIDNFVEDNMQKHQKWNFGWVDETWRPITPPLEPPGSKSDFRPVFTSSQLPTPPASLSSEGAGDPMDLAQEDKQFEPRRSTRISYTAPPGDVPFAEQPRYRRRIGRGGRLMIDRRGVKRQKTSELDERVADRYKYEYESSEDDEIYPVDWTDTLNTRYRIMIAGQKDGQSSGSHLQLVPSRRPVENHNRSASGHLLPPNQVAVPNGT
jgi:enhancer of polycomb-like protein